MTRAWVAVAGLAFACGHTAASPVEPPPRVEPPVQVANETGAQPSQGNGDEAHKPDPIDAHVATSDRVYDRLVIYIMLPKDAQVDTHWTGHFTADNKKIAGSDFKITNVTGSRATGRMTAEKLPSDTVRLFAPGVVH